MLVNQRYRDGGLQCDCLNCGGREEAEMRDPKVKPSHALLVCQIISRSQEEALTLRQIKSRCEVNYDVLTQVIYRMESNGLLLSGGIPGREKPRIYTLTRKGRMLLAQSMSCEDAVNHPDKNPQQNKGQSYVQKVAEHQQVTTFKK